MQNSKGHTGNNLHWNCRIHVIRYIIRKSESIIFSRVKRPKIVPRPKIVLSLYPERRPKNVSTASNTFNNMGGFLMFQIFLFWWLMVYDQGCLFTFKYMWKDDKRVRQYTCLSFLFCNKRHKMEFLKKIMRFFFLIRKNGNYNYHVS